MLPKFSFSPLSASSPSEMKQTQKIKTPIPHGSHVDCSASLTKLTALQAPVAILSVCVYGRPGFYWWEKRYRCRHRHRFYRCVYARPNAENNSRHRIRTADRTIQNYYFIMTSTARVFIIYCTYTDICSKYNTIRLLARFLLRLYVEHT